MKATLKLLEAVGLIVAMGAWVLEWSVIRESEQAADNLRSSIASIQNAYATAHISTVVQLEAAVTRATSTRTPAVAGPNANYSVAWDSPEVRAKWASRTIQDLRLLTILAGIIQIQQQEYGLDADRNLIALRQQLEELEGDFRSVMDSTIVPGVGPPTPNREKMRGRDAGAFDAKLGQLHAMLAPSITGTFISLQENASYWSKIFRLMFGLGSVLLISAKVLEWRIEREEQRRAPANQLTTSELEGDQERITPAPLN